MQTRKALILISALALTAAKSTFGAGVANIGSIGYNPQSGLVFGPDGNLYATSLSGGANSYGGIYQLSGVNHVTDTTVYSFTGPSTGYGPTSDLTIDSAGNFYGVTYGGGPGGMGEAYELSGPTHQNLSILASFNGSNGAYPGGGLLPDSAGNFYGTTSGNGSNLASTVFQLSGPNHQTLTTLATFTNSNNPNPGATGNLMMDHAGNLLGATFEDGSSSLGSIFELSGPDHKTLTTLVNFNGSNGSGPTGFLTEDAAGNIYGTTSTGGTANRGTIFELSGPDYQNFTTLINFPNGIGSTPLGGLTIDANGNLFGTLRDGGKEEYGAAYKLSADHQTLTNLGVFNQSEQEPGTYLTPSTDGNLYGLTLYGTAFRIQGTGFVLPEPSGLSLLLTVGTLAFRRKARNSIDA